MAWHGVIFSERRASLRRYCDIQSYIQKKTSYGRVLKFFYCTRNVSCKNTLSVTRRHTQRHTGRVKYENVGIVGMPVLWPGMG